MSNVTDLLALQQAFKVLKQKHFRSVISQLIHDALLEFNPSLNHMLYQLWQNEHLH